MNKRATYLCAMIALLAAPAASRAQEATSLGIFPAPFTLTETANPANFDAPFTRYSLTLGAPMDLIVSHCGSTLEGNTGIHLSDADGIVVASNVGDYNNCVDGHAHLTAACLPPGTYYMDVDWTPGAAGYVQTRVEGLYPGFSRSARFLGEYSDAFGSTYTSDTSDPYVGYAGENAYTGSVCYSFYIDTPMDVSVSTCGSAVGATTVYLLDEREYPTLAYWDMPHAYPCLNPEQGKIGKLNLAPGTYYAVAMGANGARGGLSVQISGTKTVPVAPITSFALPTATIGAYDPLLIHEDTRDTDVPGVGYQGYDDYRHGVCYRVTLPAEMDIEVSHCGSALEDTKAYLLDRDGKRLAYNDNYSGVNACDDSRHARLYKERLAAGTYYVVSTGADGTRGSLTTRIVCKQPERNVGSADRNYVLTRAYRDALGATWLDRLDYMDSMGRLEETVLARTSPLEEDLVSLTEYDAFGRKSKEWLPAEVPLGEGAYATPEVVKARSRQDNAGDLSPFSLTEYETSPLDRPVTQYGAGHDWHTKGKAARVRRQLTNVAEDDTLDCRVVAFASADNDLGTRVSNAGSGYATGTLSVTWTADEDGNATLEFRDREGKVVLLRQLTGPATARQRLDTYFFYDAWGNVRTVLPPEFGHYVDLLGPSAYDWARVSEGLLRDYAYLYRYDARLRLVAKRLPGQDWIRYVYDKADHPVFSQDGEQRKRGEWSFSVTDRQGRVCLTGLCDNTFAEGESALDTPVTAVRDYVSGPYRGYSVEGVDLVNARPLTVSYYDDYAFMGRHGMPDPADADYRYDALPGYGERHGDRAPSLLTGTLTAVLDDPDADTLSYVPAVTYYDYRGRAIQVKSGSHLPGGVEKEYVAYDFTGAPTRRKLVHIATGKATRTEEYAYEYDHAGRPTITTHRLDGGDIVTLADRIYDNLGRFQGVCLHGDCGALETWRTYNVRSWVKSIEGDKFTQTLFYNDTRPGGTNTPAYNGNVSAMEWKVTRPGDGKRRGYDFTYDGLSRLTQADYMEDGAPSGKFSAAYTYDRHGNMLTLKRYGNKGTTTYGLVDDVTFLLEGNRPLRATDAAPAPTLSMSGDFRDGSNALEQYLYDANGRMVADLNRGVDSIAYNALNLPKKVTFAGNGSTMNQYVYSAAGEKLAVVHHNAGGTRRTDHVANLVYGNGSLETILVEGGYYDVATARYHYYIQDHLGNNRVVVDQSGSVVQATHYYPYGTPFAESHAPDRQPYKFGGKELDTDHGLYWHDFEARYLADGRFLTPDPMAEKYYSVSPYVYCAGNPVRYVDPTGQDVWEINNQGEIINRIKDKTQDAFYMVAKDENGNYQRTFEVDPEGNKTYNSISFKYGTVESQRTTALNSTDSYDTYKVRGDANGAQMFEFMSQNTTVEWSQAKTGIEGNEGPNFLTTSHNAAKERGMSNLYSGQLYAGYTIRELNHNHPSNTGYPSGSFIHPATGLKVGEWGDVGFARIITNHRQVNRLNVPIFRIYLPSSKSYINYNSNSVRSDYGK
jgi:RHS repeat-associated protein